MHAAVCLLRAGQPRSASDAAKLGQFVGKFSWVTGDSIGLKGLKTDFLIINRFLYRVQIFSDGLFSINGVKFHHEKPSYRHYLINEEEKSCEIFARSF